MKYVISSRSWHYRLYCWFKDSKSAEPKNLCGYFWAIVGYSLLTVVAAIIVALIVAFAVIVTALPALLALIRHQPMPWNEEAVKRAKAERKKQRQPGLVRSFLAAKKARVCPLIVIEREE